MKVTVDAPAKINLTLDILGKRHDNYHFVKMIMQSVNLFDNVTVCKEDNENIEISCTNENVPCDERNTAYKAVQKFFEHTGIKNTGISIKIKKSIPVEAGLAGGSTDAAAVLVALNELFETELKKDELATIGAEVGADVPFCLYGGTMTAEGIGTILTPLPDMPSCYIVLVKPNISVSTKLAYEKADSSEFIENKNTEKVISGICDSNVPYIAKYLFNKFEEILDIDSVNDIREIFAQCGALGSCMSGSGPTVFGIFQDKSTAEGCIKVLEGEYDDVFLCRPIEYGCKIDD